MLSQIIVDRVTPGLMPSGSAPPKQISRTVGMVRLLISGRWKFLTRVIFDKGKFTTENHLPIFSNIS